MYVDADNGQILLEESTPLEVLTANAERLYSETTFKEPEFIESWMETDGLVILIEKNR